MTLDEIDDYDEYWKERRRNLPDNREEKEIEGRYSGHEYGAEAGNTNYYMSHSGDVWEENRKKALERDGYKCVDCGMTNQEHKENDSYFGDGLHIHHKKKAKLFDDKEEAHKLDNLVTVCHKCHMEREYS